MLHDTKKANGFTLIELLVAVSVIGIIAAISTQLLLDTVMTRSKQDSIEISSENMRTVIVNLTNYIQEASSITIPDTNTIKIKGKTCRTIRYNPTDKTIEEGKITSDGCSAPDIVDTVITQAGVVIDTMEFSPIGNYPSIVTLTIAGNYEDSLGEHPINFITTITPRVTL